MVYVSCNFISNAMALEYLKSSGMKDYKEEEGAPTREQFQHYLKDFGYPALILAAIFQALCCLVCWKFTQDVNEKVKITERHVNLM